MKRFKIILMIIIISQTTSVFAEDVTIFGNSFKAPKIWKDGSTEKGILVDILKAAEKDLGVYFTVKTFPWKRAYKKALDGEGGITGISKTAERLKLFDYSDPIYFDKVILVVKKGKEFRFKKL